MLSVQKLNYKKRQKKTNKSISKKNIEKNCKRAEQIKTL